MKDAGIKMSDEEWGVVEQFDEVANASTHYQVDNLLRLINDVDNSSEMSVILGLDESAEIQKIVQDVINHRNENSPYFYLEELFMVESLSVELLETMLASARYPMIKTQSSVPDYFPAAISASLLSGFFPSGILFKIDWPKLPNGWTSISGLLGHVDAKKTLLDKKDHNAAKVIVGINKRIGTLENSNSNSNAVQNALKNAKEELVDAKKTKAAVDREVDAYKEAVESGDLKTLWQIVKANMKADLDSTKTKLERHNKIKPTNGKEYKQWDTKRKELEAEIKNLEVGIADTDVSVREYLENQ